MENTEADCRAVLEQLYLYLDRELGASSVAEIDRHLDLCADCLHHIGFEREVLTIVGRKCRQSEVPAGLADQIRARLREIL